MASYIESASTFTGLETQTSLKSWTARRMHKRGEIVATKIGSTFVISPNELRRLISMYPPEVATNGD